MEEEQEKDEGVEVNREEGERGEDNIIMEG